MTGTLLDQLAWRGLLQDQTPGLAERLARGPIIGYAGFDPTASSLQVGNLVPVMLLAHLQRAGGRPVVVVGGGTGMIGDPSGRSAERPLLSREDVAANVERQRGQLARFLDFSGEAGAVLIDNRDWLGQTALLDFMREVGKHFTVSYMLQKESVRSRMDAGISYTEFSYMLLQAYDFLELYRRHQCELQVGGSDQWGNITAGIELIRRVAGADAHGLVAPMVTTAAGVKFGKSEGNAVWLDPALTSPYQFFQYWINTDDRDVDRYLRMFTLRPQAEIAAFLADHARDPSARTPQRALAADVTGMVHGSGAAVSAAEASRILFGDLEPGEAHADTWRLLATELPSITLPPAITADTPVLELVASSTLVKSRGDARRQLAQGGIAVNGQRVSETATAGTPLAGGYYLVSRGKKSSFLFTPPSD
ncbi:MAG: tyrosine--tRNA ligase [Gemmatimonadota bacterium]|nr:tyrosine--tRNA ligase [Gemmatimonadota bacterium]MDH4351029.1 tyrosine--tRNA ligase [Gemmatimonadota bacterium]MDH5197331.1 tyrosine--tRNA ligase [Gemmatimonadota bacterium]